MRSPRIVALTLAALVLALVLAACGEDESGGSAATTATATATAPAALDQALWPDPASGDAAADPVAIARSFVEDFVGVEDPAFGEFQLSEPRAGEVPVLLRGEDGERGDRVIATIVLRQLDGERWFVTSAHSPQVEISAPEVLTAITSPVRVAGRGEGFEGNIVLRVHTQFEPKPLAEVAVQAGSMGAIRPFEATLDFDAPAAGAPGAIVARTGSGLATGGEYAAFPVRLR